MTQTGRVELMLLGQALTVRTSAPPDYVRSLASYVEERVAALRAAGARDPMAALALAALDLTDALFRARDARQRGEREVEARMDALLALLDRVAPPGAAERAQSS